jgi:hypothetical protein
MTAVINRKLARTTEQTARKPYNGTLRNSASDVIHSQSWHREGRPNDMYIRSNTTKAMTLISHKINEDTYKVA